ncbi:hypothetical protein, partial [Streptomyces sp. NPDC054838]
MSADENSPDSKAASPGSHPNGTTATKRRDQRAEAAEAPTVLPAPLAEKTRAAALALRGTVGRAGWLWQAALARKGVSAGAATGTAAVIAISYAAGRRAGLRRRG